MCALIGLTLAAIISAAQTSQCKAGQVLAVEHGRDYVLTVCGAGLVALRGVEPPLRTAAMERPPVGGGELLGGKNVAPDAIAYLSIAVGQHATFVYDGYRIGDREGRRYAYVYLPDKTFLNAQMIQRGYGYADRQGSHPRRDEFIAIEASARRLKVGYGRHSRKATVDSRESLVRGGESTCQLTLQPISTASHAPAG